MIPREAEVMLLALGLTILTIPIVFILAALIHAVWA